MFTWSATVLKQYAVFSGRTRRREFWSFTLINAVLILLFQMLNRLVLNALQAPHVSGATGVVIFAYAIVVVLYALAALTPLMSVSVRRLHDTGNSGWLVLIAFVPFLGPLVFFALCAFDSQPFSNRYGPSPKPIRVKLTSPANLSDRVL